MFLLYQIVVIQTFFVISLPFYMYGITKWIEFQQHFIIHKRFPLISILMCIAAFLNGICYLITTWIKYLSNDNNILYASIPQSVSFFIYGLINLRLFFTLLRWKKHQNDLKYIKEPILLNSDSINMEISMNSSQTKTSPTSKKTSISDTKQMEKQYFQKTKPVYVHWFSMTILLLSVCGTIVVCTYTLPMIVYSCWTLMMIITVILVIIVFIKGVNDGIGSRVEALTMLCMFILVSAMVTLFEMGGDVAYIGFAFISLAPYFQGLYPIYIALFYIYKCEYTLNVENWTQKHQNIIFVCRQSVMSHSIDIKDEKNDMNIDTNLPFFEFLKKKQNYIAFKEYLSYCWALENLLFVERASVIYYILLKYANKETTETNVKKRNKFAKRSEFKFLRSIYKEYSKRINEKQSTCNDFTDAKPQIFKIYQQMCSGFIEEGALNQINISHETRNEIMFLLKSTKNINKFQSVNDFLYLFDDALAEVYVMLMSLYKFKFAKYIQLHAKNGQMETN